MVGISNIQERGRVPRGHQGQLVSCTNKKHFTALPINNGLGWASVFVCAAGYFGYLVLSRHAAGDTIIFSASLLTRFETFLDGNMAAGDIDASLKSLQSFFAHCKDFKIDLSVSVSERCVCVRTCIYLFR